MTAVEKLAMDFKMWGRVAVLRIQKLTRKYGVLLDMTWSNGKAG